MKEQNSNGVRQEGARGDADDAVEPEGPFRTMDNLHEAADRAEPRLLEQTGRISSAEDRRFSEPEGFRYFWKPPAITFGFGTPAIVLIVLQMWFPEINRALGNPAGEYVGLVRIGAILVGAALLFAAAPLYKPADWTPQRQQEEDQAHEYFRNKRGI